MRQNTNPILAILLVFALILIPLANGAATFTPNNDIVVIYASGQYSTYNAIVNTNTSRGIALLTAVNAITSNDVNIYLKAETYDIATNTINQNESKKTGQILSGMHLYGAGKFKTKILSNWTYNNEICQGQCIQFPIIQAGINSITADLGIYSTLKYIGGTGYSNYSMPWGTITSGSYGNSTLRNVYLQGYTDGIYFASRSKNIPNSDVYVYNVTSNTMWDTSQFLFSVNCASVSCSGSNTVYIFDSNFTANAIVPNFNHQARGIALSTGGNVIVVNSIMSATNGIADTSSIEIVSSSNVGNMFVYGGHITASSPTNEYTINNVNTGSVYVNSSTTYNSADVQGTVTNIIATYGAYSYSQAPQQIPIVLSSNSFIASNSAIDLGQLEFLSTTWNGMASPYTVNYLVYNSIEECTSGVYSGLAGSSNTFGFNTVLCGTGSITANLIVSDNSIAQVTNSITFTINPALSPTISTSATNVDAGQAIVFTAASGGGTSPFTYNFLVVNTITGSLFSNSLYTLVASTSNTFTYIATASNVGNIIQANVIVTDSATSNVMANSIKTQAITIDSAPSSSNLVFTNASFLVGGSTTLSATLSGGTGPFNANFVYSNGIVANTVSGIALGGTASFVFKPIYTGTYTFNVMVTDSGTTSSYVFNTIYNSITVNSVPQPPPFTGGLPPSSTAKTTSTTSTATSSSASTTSMAASTTISLASTTIAQNATNGSVSSSTTTISQQGSQSGPKPGFFQSIITWLGRLFSRLFS